jgi:hypothetical protein
VKAIVLARARVVVIPVALVGTAGNLIKEAVAVGESYTETP